MRTVEELTEGQKEFFDKLPKNLRETFLATLPSKPMSRSEVRKQKLEEHLKTAEEYRKTLETYAIQITKVLMNNKITEEDFKEVAEYPKMENGLTLAKKPGRKDKAEEPATEEGKAE